MASKPNIEQVLQEIQKALSMLVLWKEEIVENDRKVGDVKLPGALYAFMQDTSHEAPNASSPLMISRQCGLKLPCLIEDARRLQCEMNDESCPISNDINYAMPLEQSVNSFQDVVRANSVIPAIYLMRKLASTGLLSLMPDAHNMRALFSVCVVIADKFTVSQWGRIRFVNVVEVVSALSWYKKNDELWAELLVTIMSWLFWAEYGSPEVMVRDHKLSVHRLFVQSSGRNRHFPPLYNCLNATVSSPIPPSIATPAFDAVIKSDSTDADSSCNLVDNMSHSTKKQLNVMQMQNVNQMVDKNKQVTRYVKKPVEAHLTPKQTQNRVQPARKEHSFAKRAPNNSIPVLFAGIEEHSPAYAHKPNETYLSRKLNGATRKPGVKTKSTASKQVSKAKSKSTKPKVSKETGNPSKKHTQSPVTKAQSKSTKQTPKAEPHLQQLLKKPLSKQQFQNSQQNGAIQEAEASPQFNSMTLSAKTIPQSKSKMHSNAPSTPIHDSRPLPQAIVLPKLLVKLPSRAFEPINLRRGANFLGGDGRVSPRTAPSGKPINLFGGNKKDEDLSTKNSSHWSSNSSPKGKTSANIGLNAKKSATSASTRQHQNGHLKVEREIGYVSSLNHQSAVVEDKSMFKTPKSGLMKPNQTKCNVNGYGKLAGAEADVAQPKSSAKSSVEKNFAKFNCTGVKEANHQDDKADSEKGVKLNQDRNPVSASYGKLKGLKTPRKAVVLTNTETSGMTKSQDSSVPKNSRSMYPERDEHS